MNTPNLWPDFESANVQTPRKILLEQAAFLGEKTAHILRAEVILVPTSKQRFRYTLNIVAPALNNYRVHFLSIDHEHSIYPVSVITSEGHISMAYNEKEFIMLLKAIFNNKETIDLVNKLIRDCYD